MGFSLRRQQLLRCQADIRAGTAGSPTAHVYNQCGVWGAHVRAPLLHQMQALSCARVPHSRTEGQARKAAVQSAPSGCQQHSTPCGRRLATAVAASSSSTRLLPGTPTRSVQWMPQVSGGGGGRSRRRSGQSPASASGTARRARGTMRCRRCIPWLPSRPANCMPRRVMTYDSAFSNSMERLCAWTCAKCTTLAQRGKATASGPTACKRTLQPLTEGYAHGDMQPLTQLAKAPVGDLQVYLLLRSLAAGCSHALEHRESRPHSYAGWTWAHPHCTPSCSLFWPLSVHSSPTSAPGPSRGLSRRRSAVRRCAERRPSPAPTSSQRMRGSPLATALLLQWCQQSRLDATIRPRKPALNVILDPMLLVWRQHVSCVALYRFLPYM